MLKLTTYSDKAIILGGCQKEKKEETLNSCAKEENDKQVIPWKEGGCLTCEPISKCSIGKFSILHSILWKTLRIFLAFLGLSSSFDASHKQLAATFCKKLSYPRKLMDELHGHWSFMLFQVRNTTITYWLLRKCKNKNTFCKTRTLIQWSSMQLLDLVEVNYRYKTSGKLSIIPKLN